MINDIIMHGNNNVIPSAAERRKRGRPRKDERNNRGDENINQILASRMRPVFTTNGTSCNHLPKHNHNTSNDVADFNMVPSKPFVSNPLEEVRHKQPSLPITKKPSVDDKSKSNTATSSKRPEYKASTSVETSDDMDVSFDNVNLDQPWLAMGVDELRKSYGKLHERHRKLRELRETEAEELLKRYKHAMEAEVAAMNEQMKALQAENQHLRMNNSGSNSIVIDSKQDQTSNATSMEQDKLVQGLKEQLELAKEREKSYIDQLEQLQSSELLELYSKLTRTIVTRVNTDNTGEIIFDFEQEGRNGVIQYRLIFSLEDEDVEFMPTIDAKSDPEMWSRLPDFLREPLLFNQDELPMFFWRVTNHMNHKHKAKGVIA